MKMSNSSKARILWLAVAQAKSELLNTNVIGSYFFVADDIISQISYMAAWWDWQA